jgi:hypothetical protein
MRNFSLHTNFVDIIENTGALKRIYFDANSGKTYWRFKVPNIVGTKHSGIYLGSDSFGVQYFLHNHYHIGHACLVTAKEFSLGQSIKLYDEKCTNHPLKVIEIALNQALRKEAYRPFNYNCQSYTNEACHNHRGSEDVGKWGERLLLFSLIFVGFSMVFEKE